MEPRAGADYDACAKFGQVSCQPGLLAGMHRKKSRRWAKFMALISLFTLASAGLWAQTVNASSETPLPVCSVNECTVTFEFSGAPQLWTPPAGTTDLRFDLYGAQGGQGSQSSIAGGLGGRVSGSLISVPDSLLVYVGGVGARGAGSAGGYNGGGDAGKGHGDEGSGGGSTDLRTTSAVTDRIVVAGGGGGTGGYNWLKAGLGGSGGGLSGAAGGWGQAAPGLGGTQNAGGSAGQPNGGSIGEAGGFGFGGKGASSFFSGGGGGGGGYFGGGGGGSDTDSCCYNGGGGGGGSSYAKSGSVSSVQHASGVRLGNGRAIITYRLEPVVSSPAPTPSPTVSLEPTPAMTSSPTPTSTPSPTTTSSPTPTSTPSPTASAETSPAPIAVATPSPTPTPTPTASPSSEQVTTPSAKPSIEPAPTSAPPIPAPATPASTPVVLEVIEHLPPAPQELEVVTHDEPKIIEIAVDYPTLVAVPTLEPIPQADVPTTRSPKVQQPIVVPTTNLPVQNQPSISHVAESRIPSFESTSKPEAGIDGNVTLVIGSTLCLSLLYLLTRKRKPRKQHSATWARVESQAGRA